MHVTLHSRSSRYTNLSPLVSTVAFFFLAFASVAAPPPGSQHSFIARPVRSEVRARAVAVALAPAVSGEGEGEASRAVVLDDGAAAATVEVATATVNRKTSAKNLAAAQVVRLVGDMFFCMLRMVGNLRY